MAKVERLKILKIIPQYKGINLASKRCKDANEAAMHWAVKWGVCWYNDDTRCPELTKIQRNSRWLHNTNKMYYRVLPIFEDLFFDMENNDE